MKCYISVVCVLSAFIAVNLAAPSTIEIYEISPVHHQVKRQTTNSQQEALNRVITFSNQKIQYLRRLCPQLFQVLDNVIQNVTSQVFRVVGGALLRSGGLGGGGGGAGGSSNSNRVSVVLPTFPPDEDDDDNDENTNDVDVRVGSGSKTTIPPDTTIATRAPAVLNADAASNEVTENSESASVVSESNPAKRHTRIARAAGDQDAATSGDNGPDPAEDLANNGDDADRNKRFLPFGGNGQSAGGSGNFLFDFIRNTADRAARTVGTVYRMVAGTENLEYTATEPPTSFRNDATAPDSQLIAGSGATEESDEKEAGVGGVAEVDVQGKSTEGIPGPITRLLVIANRGIANLIQDLILRLAQTSERIVNFKARLVTALI